MKNMVLKGPSWRSVFYVCSIGLASISAAGFWAVGPALALAAPPLEGAGNPENAKDFLDFQFLHFPHKCFGDDCILKQKNTFPSLYLENHLFIFVQFEENTFFCVRISHIVVLFGQYSCLTLLKLLSFSGGAPNAASAGDTQVLSHL